MIRLLPELRCAWAAQGEAAVVPISGRNARRVLYGSLNLRTGHRLCLIRPKFSQVYFQELLRLIRSRYGHRSVWLLLDNASWHVAKATTALAQALDIHLIWLPKQWSELNPMDQLWKELKGTICANYQYASIEDHAEAAADWFLQLPPRNALRKASVLSEHFWLRALV